MGTDKSEHPKTIFFISNFKTISKYITDKPRRSQMQKAPRVPTSPEEGEGSETASDRARKGSAKTEERKMVPKKDRVHRVSA